MSSIKVVSTKWEKALSLLVYGVLVALIVVSCRAASDLFQSTYNDAGYYAFFTFFPGVLGLGGFVLGILPSSGPLRFQIWGDGYAKLAVWCCLLLAVVAGAASVGNSEYSSLSALFLALALWFAFLRLLTRTIRGSEMTDADARPEGMYRWVLFGLAALALLDCGAAVRSLQLAGERNVFHGVFDLAPLLGLYLSGLAAAVSGLVGLALWGPELMRGVPRPRVLRILRHIHCWLVGVICLALGMFALPGMGASYGGRLVVAAFFARGVLAVGASFVLGKKGRAFGVPGASTADPL